MAKYNPLHYRLISDLLYQLQQNFSSPNYMAGGGEMTETRIDFQQEDHEQAWKQSTKTIPGRPDS